MATTNESKNKMCKCHEKAIGNSPNVCAMSKRRQSLPAERILIRRLPIPIYVCDGVYNIHTYVWVYVLAVNLWLEVMRQHAKHSYVTTITQIRRRKQPKSNNNTHSGKSQFIGRSNTKPMEAGNKLFIANAGATALTERELAKVAVVQPKSNHSCWNQHRPQAPHIFAYVGIWCYVYAWADRPAADLQM